jgi:hypothetical protein
MAAMTQWLFNFVVSRAVPNMLATAGSHGMSSLSSTSITATLGSNICKGYGTYIIFGSFCFAMFVFVWFFVPETKGKP